jgi:hypothetical protein
MKRERPLILPPYNSKHEWLLYPKS